MDPNGTPTAALQQPPLRHLLPGSLQLVLRLVLQLLQQVPRVPALPALPALLRPPAPVPPQVPPGRPQARQVVGQFPVAALQPEPRPTLWPRPTRVTPQAQPWRPLRVPLRSKTSVHLGPCQLPQHMPRQYEPWIDAENISKKLKNDMAVAEGKHSGPCGF